MPLPSGEASGVVALVVVVVVVFLRSIFIVH